MEVTILDPAKTIGFLYHLRDNIRDFESTLDDEEISFFNFCLAHMKESESQCLQDMWALYDVNSGGHLMHNYFVEFGGTNGKDSSNSYMLEKEYGWHGIVCEPNPFWKDQLTKNRGGGKASLDFRCVSDETGIDVAFLCTGQPDLSTIKGFENNDYNKDNRMVEKEVFIETVTLKDLLDTHNAPEHIDYLSIDSEGTELMILEKFFAEENQFTIDMITVEHNFVDETRKAIESLLVENGYKSKFRAFSRWDDFYKLEKQ
jgi:FkbM family methyltransferase